ncbi:MAG: acyl-CoA dehydrogenase family protein, partial [Acidimicrobiales bacterium]
MFSGATLRLRLTGDELRFRDELRQWLKDTLPGLRPKPAADDWVARREFDTQWQRHLFDAGYAGIAWSKAYGERGATASEELIFLEETEAAGAPYVGCNFVDTLHAGPTILSEGSAEQASTHLVPILKGEHDRFSLVPGLRRERQHF